MENIKRNLTSQQEDKSSNFKKKWSSQVGSARHFIKEIIRLTKKFIMRYRALISGKRLIKTWLDATACHINGSDQMDGRKAGGTHNDEKLGLLCVSSENIWQHTYPKIFVIFKMDKKNLNASLCNSICRDLHKRMRLLLLSRNYPWVHSHVVSDSL